MVAVFMNELKKTIMHQTPLGWTISIPKISQYDFKESILHFLLLDFGYTSGMIADVMHILNSGSGKMVCSHTHRLVRDREYLIITPLVEEEAVKYYIEDFKQVFEVPLPLNFKILPVGEMQLLKDPLFAFLDIDKITLPLILRKWQHGDSFVPFGMKGFKKISDYLIDHKVSIPEKENTWVLTDGEKIVWLIGQRIDDRFKISRDTKNVLVIEFKKILCSCN